jgi:hypothetical protein
MEREVMNVAGGDCLERSGSADIIQRGATASRSPLLGDCLDGVTRQTREIAWNVSPSTFETRHVVGHFFLTVKSRLCRYPVRATLVSPTLAACSGARPSAPSTWSPASTHG